MSSARASTWQGDINAFTLSPRDLNVISQFGFGLLYGRYHSRFPTLHQLSKGSTFFGCDPADTFLAAGERTFLAEVSGAQLR